MKDDAVIIDCHSAWSKGFMRLLMLTMPFWLTMGVIGTLMSVQPPMWGIPGPIFYPGLVLGCGGWLLALLSNRIIITADSISLPSFWGAKRSLKDLHKLSFATSLSGELCFQSHSGETDRRAKLYMPVRKLNRAKLNALIQSLRQRAPQCQIETDLCLKAFPLKPQPQVSQKAAVSIKYRSHEKFMHLFQSLLFCEKKILPFWIFVSFLPLLTVSPMLIYRVLNPHEAFADQPALLANYTDYFSRFGTALGNSFTSYSNIFAHPLLICGLVVAILAMCLVILKFLFQPNALQLSDQDLSLRLKIGWFEAAIKCPWETISTIDLAADENFIKVNRTTGNAVHLKLDAINMVDRQRLTAALDRFAPDLKREARFLEAMTPPQQSSYTELWLQSLSTPPKRANLLPLTDGYLIRDGKYKVVRQLGAGGQGSAYLADVCDDDESAQIVLKEFILPVFVDAQVRKLALEKFEHEAKLLKQLDHPQIVKMMDYFLEDHRAYLVLQHIDGFSLRQIMESTASASLPNSNWVIDLALQMCDILNFLHALAPPLVHRDFTPDNLILDKNGTLKLIDFDVAQQREQTTSATVVGKHAYLPPEQFRGKPCPQSDIYALGATLYFLLTGCDPEPLTSSHPLGVRPEIATALDDLVGRCTQLDLNQRYETAAQIKMDLQNMQSGSPDPGATIQVKETAAVCE